MEGWHWSGNSDAVLVFKASGDRFDFLENYRLGFIGEIEQSDKLIRR